MNEKELTIFQKIKEGNNITDQRYIEGLYNVESMIKVVAAALESMDNGNADEVDLIDIQRTLNIAVETLQNGSTGELMDLLSQIS